MTSQSSLAVVIVTYNRVNELRLTLVALVAQGIDFKDIFVINNNSSDGTTKVIQRDFPGINLINLSENIASAGGFATGMQIVHQKGYHWTWLFNDDSRPIKGALDSIRPYINESTKHKIGMLKIANLNKEGKAILLYWKGVRKPVYTEIRNEMVETDLVTFDGCLISADLMNVIGYCDPLYFMGTYEFDYCLKAREVGYKIYTIPNGLIEDEKLGSESGTPPWRQYYNTRNHLWLGLKRKSFLIVMAWAIREVKYTYSILRYADKKSDRLLFKLRAIRDALFNVRGKRYFP